jgi:hypothetical protein
MVGCSGALVSGTTRELTQLAHTPTTTKAGSEKSEPALCGVVCRRSDRPRVHPIGFEKSTFGASCAAAVAVKYVRGFAPENRAVITAGNWRM